MIAGRVCRIRSAFTWENCRSAREAAPTAATETEVREPLPVVLNGQILPGGVGSLRLQGPQGHAAGGRRPAPRNLMPYLADAVPGWFQATLTLYDPARQ